MVRRIQLSYLLGVIGLSFCQIIWAQEPQDPQEPVAVQVAAAPVTRLPDGTKLVIPVKGVKPSELTDTFTALRSGGRTHNAIDIMASRETPVLAAADGEIIRLVTNALGGTTLYLLSTDRKVVFYYAHLDYYAEGLFIGQKVKQGEVIAFVGDTGNAGIGNFHLHFAVWLVEDPKRFSNGTNLNPYPLLRGGRLKP
jgi:murein DD-endopeptidase MepM/ murein hydrolase activator NlpD